MTPATPAAQPYGYQPTLRDDKLALIVERLGMGVYVATDTHVGQLPTQYPLTRH